MNQPELSRASWRTSSRSGANGNCVEVAVVETNEDDAAAIDGRSTTALLATALAGVFE